MADSIITPVMVGLAVGIGFIVVFSMFVDNSAFQRPSHYIGKYLYMTLTIEGLKGSYSIGEPIDFTLNVKGYGTNCIESPDIMIRNTTGDVVWLYEPINLMGCGDPDLNGRHEISERWNAKERLSIPESYGSIPLIKEAGSYTLTGSYYSEPLNQQFTVS